MNWETGPGNRMLSVKGWLQKCVKGRDRWSCEDI